MPGSAAAASTARGSALPQSTTSSIPSWLMSCNFRRDAASC